MTKKVLILGGSGEARALAEALISYPDIEVITSLAGRTRNPEALPGKVLSGGFGGAAGLAGYLRDEEVALLVDATHPFAARMSENAARASAQSGCPCLHLQRPAWTAMPGDRWIEVADLQAAAAALEDFPVAQRKCAFLATGHRGLAAFADCRETRFLIRLIEAPEVAPPLKHYEILRQRGPFALDKEIALFREKSVTLVIAKNSGGAGSYPKIEAARILGLPVIMISRPKVPVGDAVADPTAALARILEKLELGQDSLTGD
jgi:precorrin-6A/cobalt-precorrin-6A reductase